MPRRRDHVHPEARTEDGEGDQQQRDGFQNGAAGQEPALRGCREQQHRNTGGDEDEDALRPSDIDQQKIGVEDEQEGQRRRPQTVEEGHDPGLDRIPPRHCRRREAGKPHGWRHVGHNAEIEDEQMHRDQGHDQPVLRPQRHDHRRQQRRDDDIVRRRRQPHPQDQRQDRRQEQDRQQLGDIAARDGGDLRRHHLDHIRQGGTDAGLADRAHDDPGGRGGDADADHVARARDHPVDKVIDARPEGRAHGLVARLILAAHHQHQGTLGQQDEDHEGRGPEGRQAGRQTVDHQRPDQHHHRQQEIQPRPHSRTGQRQLGNLGIGVVDLQRILARGDFQQRHIGDAKQCEDHIVGRGPEDRTDPAHRVIDQQRQDADRHDAEGDAQQPAQPWAGRVSTRQPAHAGLHGLQMDDIDKRDIGNRRRNDGVLDDLGIGNAHIFHHQEGRSPHDRRHDLTVDRGRHLDRAGLFTGKAHALHQRDGKGAGGHHVGNRGPRNQPGHGRADNGRLRRPAAQVTHQRKCDLNEVIPGPRLIQQRAEQHEQEDEAGGHAKRDPEDALGGDPLMVRDLGQRVAFMGDDLGHLRPEEGIDQKQRGHDHQRRTKRAARDLQQQQDADDRDHQILRDRPPDPHRDLVVEDIDIQRRTDGHDGHGPFPWRHPVARAAQQDRHDHRHPDHRQPPGRPNRACADEQEG